MTEVELWANPSPTNNFADQNITLSDSINNYKFIKITHADHKTLINNPISFYVVPSDFVKTIAALGNPSYALGAFVISGGGTQRWVRQLFYVDATTIHFNTAERCNTSGTDAAYAIPLSIIGIL